MPFDLVESAHDVLDSLSIGLDPVFTARLLNSAHELRESAELLAATTHLDDRQQKAFRVSLDELEMRLEIFSMSH
ncbi:MAG: hypothetical protein EOP18_09205 [Rhizobiaceae bacterium]|nr:MAG: hypothetical protein EOP18_09205 [Rhizobiaceae bacterium]